MLTHTNYIAAIALCQKGSMTTRHGNSLIYSGLRWLGLSGQSGCYLGKYPGISLCTASNHNGVATRLFFQSKCLRATGHIAVTHNGNRNRCLYAGNGIPIGHAMIHLHSIAAMHCHGLGARLLHATRKLNAGFVIYVLTSAKFHRYRMLNCRTKRLHNGGGKLRVAHVPQQAGQNKRLLEVEVSENKCRHGGLSVGAAKTKRNDCTRCRVKRQNHRNMQKAARPQ